jgi:aminomuconate-semialdehyde/2-hydroxymuconate-6-semialdehyde dehydrogenase
MNSKGDELTNTIFNYIGGELCPPQNGRYLDNINPATGLVYSQTPDSDIADVECAIAAAKKAQPAWGRLTAERRGQYLRRLAIKIKENREAYARAESIDSGKPFSLALSLDIPRAEHNLEFFADAITQWTSHTFANSPQVLNWTDHAPIGVVGCISPWNLPLYLFTWKIAPALATGNTVVAKPSELTPMTAYWLSRSCQEIGLPPGVLNIVHGTGPSVGAPLVAHQDVRAISFTGSTATGHIIASEAARTFKKVSLEMGGKNANIVFADCDFEKAVRTTVRSSFLNQGQICLCGSRVLVEESLYEKFRDALVGEVKKLKVGDPLDPATEQGALVSEPHLQKVLGFLAKATKEGGRVLAGGQRAVMPGPLAPGYFVEPTLIEGLNPASSLNQAEVFGPVATLIPFQSEKEAIEIANGTSYGLSASVWTSQLDRAHRVAKSLEVGTVWVNTWLNRDLRAPFGGVKDSGIGREGGLAALEFFTEVKTICMEFK